jgi:succinate dehydrogenase / fumarate reductase flavoprotein subunit
MTGLIATCRRYESDGSIERLTGNSLLSLIVTDERKCAGVVLCNNVTDEITSIQADAVVLCTGGANGIYGKTTGSVMNDGSATGLALEAGAGLANLEMIQYHPTTVDFGDKRLLITEAARGEGRASLYDAKRRAMVFHGRMVPRTRRSHAA